MNFATSFLANAVFGLWKGHAFSSPTTRTVPKLPRRLGGKGDDPRSGGLVTLLVGVRMPPSPRKWSARQRVASQGVNCCRIFSTRGADPFWMSANSWACLPYLNRLSNNMWRT